MITYSRIGHFGRLGNQLFQFAATYGISKKLGYEVKFPIDNVTDAITELFQDGIVRDVYFDLPKLFDIPKELLAPKSDILKNLSYKYSEPHFHYSGDSLLIKDGTDLQGYYQSDKYFAEVEDSLRSVLKFKPEIIRAAKKVYPVVEGEIISIHVRRGDYVALNSFHPTCSPDYYAEAAQHFVDSNCHFMIFSDDIEYCKQAFGESDNIHYSIGNDQFVDLCLMSMCDHNIIANSSFSWWGAWLNPNENKKVIAPKKWFGPAYSHYNINDLFCKNWIVK